MNRALREVAPGQIVEHRRLGVLHVITLAFGVGMDHNRGIVRLVVHVAEGKHGDVRPLHFADALMPVTQRFASRRPETSAFSRAART
jgi:hypothetical protein